MSVKRFLTKKTKGGKVAFYLSMATLAFMGLVGVDGCIPGNANTVKTQTPFKGIYAVKQIKGRNQFATNLSSHQPFRILARHIASNRPQLYGDSSRYYHKTFAKNIGHGMVIVGQGNKKYRMSNKQWKRNQAQAKAYYDQTLHGDNSDGQYVANQKPFKASHHLTLK